jgi:hypothetical protein
MPGWTNWDSCSCSSLFASCTLAMKRLQESRIVEISIYGLTRGVELNLHSYSTFSCKNFLAIYSFFLQHYRRTVFFTSFRNFMFLCEVDSQMPFAGRLRSSLTF